MFGIEFIKKLKPCKWRYKEPLDDGLEHFGFIAQEVDAIAPRHTYAFVGTKADGSLGLVYNEFIGPIVMAIQQLEKRISDLENSIKGECDAINESELGNY